MGLWIINGISWDYLGKLCCDLTAPEKVFFAKAIYLVRFKIAFLTVDIVPLGIALASPCPDGAPIFLSRWDWTLSDMDKRWWRVNNSDEEWIIVMKSE